MSIAPSSEVMPQIFTVDDTFVLLLRTADARAALPRTLDHYSRCQARISSIRVFADDAPYWSALKAQRALAGVLVLPDEERAQLSSFARDRLLDGSAARDFWTLLADENQGAPPMTTAVFLASDDVWIDCQRLAAMFQEWKIHSGRRIVGSIPVSHKTTRPEPGTESRGAAAAIAHTYHAAVREGGQFSMVALDGAFLHSHYVRHGARVGGARAPAFNLKNDSAVSDCDEIAINVAAALVTEGPPVYVPGNFTRLPLATDQEVRSQTATECLNAIAAGFSGELPLVWGEWSEGMPTSNASPGPLDQAAASLSTPSRSVLDYERFGIETDPAIRARLLPDDSLVAVTAVLVMEFGPNDVALTVRYLHANYAFIKEFVVWNNQDALMNHHMFPYDVAMRYVRTSRNYGPYAKYLGCLAARHEICYFQHTRARPQHLRPMHIAFLESPASVFTAAMDRSIFDWKRRITFEVQDARANRTDVRGYADLSGGTFAHKENVRHYLERALALRQSDHGQAFYNGSSPTAPTSTDCDFAFSLPWPAVVLPLERENDNRPKLPQRQPSPDDLATSLFWATSAENALSAGADAQVAERSGREGQHATDAQGESYRHRATCADTTCLLMSSVDGWPGPVTLHLDGDRNHSYFASLSTPPPPPFDLKYARYHRAVDGDLSTFWELQQMGRSEYVGLDMMRPTVIVGVDLWLKQAPTAKLNSSSLRTAPEVQVKQHAADPYYVTIVDCIVLRQGSLYPGLERLIFHCPAMSVRYIRLALNRDSYTRLQIVELGAIRLPGASPAKPLATVLPDNRVPAALPDRSAAVQDRLANITVAYVIQDDVGAPFHPTTLAFVEEACELGCQQPGSVTLIHAGSADPVKVDDIVRRFELVGSKCNLQNCVAYEYVPRGQSPDESASADPTRVAASASEGFESWWTSSFRSYDVVLFRAGSSSLVGLLRKKSEFAPSCMFSARVDDADELGSEVVELADGLVFSTKELHDAYQSVRGGSKPRSVRQTHRILYPLRTLAEPLAFVLEPTMPAAEEVLLFITPATQEWELSMFYTHALPILQTRADVKLVNLTVLAETRPSVDGERDGQPVDLDAILKGNSWTTLLDVFYYVSIYPSRIIWLLDSSVGASYYASMASVQGARFVAYPKAVPYYERRFLHWNATCEWTGAGFEFKARELVSGKFFLSTSQNELLEQRSADFLSSDSQPVVDEWPMRREMHPFANNITTIKSYVSELLSTTEYTFATWNSMAALRR